MTGFHRSSGVIGVVDRWSGWDSQWFRVVLILLTLGAFWVIGLALFIPDSGLVDILVAPALAFVAMVLLPLVTLAISNNNNLLKIFAVLYIFFSVAVWRNRDFSDNSVDLQLLLQFGFWAYGGLLGLINLPLILRNLNSFLMMAVVAMLLMICGSVLWSPSFAYSAMSATLSVCFFLFAFTLAQKLSEKEMVWVITYACLLVVVPSLAMSPFQSSFAEVTGEGTAAIDRLRGMTGHPIALALMCGVLMLCSTAIFINRWGSRIFPIVFVAIAIPTALLTQSRMPLVAALFASMAVPAYRLKVFGRASGLIFFFMAVLTVIVIVSGLQYIVPADVLAMLSRTGEVEEILSFTGRSEIWSFVLSKIAERPAFGWGVGSGAWIILPNYTDPTMNIMHAHNAILHFTFSTGLVGGLLLVTVLAIMVYRSFKYGSVFTSTFVVMLLIAGITEAVYANNRPNMMTFFFYAAIGMCARLGPVSTGRQAQGRELKRRAPRRARVEWGNEEAPERSPA